MKYVYCFITTFCFSVLLSSCESNTEKTIIEDDFCYMIQEMNEVGEPVESYVCMVYERNLGYTFEEALDSIKPDIDALVQRMINDEKNSSNYEADKWELRHVVRNVKNAPNDKLVYISINLFMFSRVYTAYTMVYEYCIVDSEGNIYYVAEPLDNEDNYLLL